MAKIDVTKLEGYAAMSAEDKLKALENYDLPDTDLSGYVTKASFDKLATETAEWKRKYYDGLSETQRKTEQAAEEKKALEEENKTLRRNATIADNTAKYLSMGYSQELATETATALSDGNMDVVFANGKKAIDALIAANNANNLKQTPRPDGGNGRSEVTREQFLKMDLDSKQKFARENPSLFNSFMEE
jgi:hypothetical protein